MIGKRVAHPKQAALVQVGTLDVDAFAQEYQRRPESVITYMVHLGLLDKTHDPR